MKWISVSLEICIVALYNGGGGRPNHRNHDIILYSAVNGMIPFLFRSCLCFLYGKLSALIKLIGYYFALLYFF